METPRVLNFFHSTALGLGSTLGIGIYVLLGNIVKSTPGLTFEVSVLLTGVTALLSGLIFTEFSVWFLKANSTYPFFYACGNENVSFSLGWILILKHLAGTACVIKGTLLFVDALAEEKISTFLVDTVPLNTTYFSPYFDFVCVVVIIIITIFLVLGMKDNIIVKSIFTVCNMLLLLAVLVAGFLKGDTSNWNVEEPMNRKTASCNFVMVVKQAAVLFVGFIGFDTIGLSEEELKKRQKLVPAAVFVTIMISLVAYSGVGNTLLLINPYNELVLNAGLPFAFGKIGWNVFKWILIFGAFFGFLTSLFGILYPLPRIIIAMANDGVLFHFFGKYNEKTNTPLVSIGISGLIIAIGVGFFTFKQLINLTVIPTLFILTVLAINIIIFRYTPKSTDEEPTSISTAFLFPLNPKDSTIYEPVTLKSILKNLFNFKQEATKNITITITIINLSLFGISSVALSVLLIFYLEHIRKSQIEFVLSSAASLMLLLLTLVSLTCQPKSSVPFFFKVPFTPLIPCLSIFLNIFLLISFGAVPWIYFAIWLGAGIIPYSIWYFFKCRRRIINETSIHDINKMNTLKLNEAVWKIITERPSFLGGKENPAFREESDEKSEIKINTKEEKVKYNNEKTVLQLKRAEIFETAEIVPEEKTEPLKVDEDLKYFKEDKKTNFPAEEEKVEWECVAEIHREDFSQESVVLEIVDTTYNFLSDALTRDGDSLSQKSLDTIKNLSTIESEEFSGGKKENTSDYEFGKETNFVKYKADSSPTSVNKKSLESSIKEVQPKIPTSVFKKNFLDEIHDTVRLKKEKMKVQSNQNFIFDKLGKSETNFQGKEINQPQESIMVFQDETLKNMTEITYPESPKGVDDSEEKPVSNEQSKKKEFKEKLNQLLKNQIDINSTLKKSFLNTNSISKKDSALAEVVDGEDDEMYKTIKTLNKAQIKGKLELLLTKGPPKRPSLKKSFGIKMKNSDKEVPEKKEEVEVNRTEVVTS